MVEKKKSKRPQKTKLPRKPPREVGPIGREMTCSATNGGVSASATCNTSAKGDAESCMADVKKAVGLAQ